MFFSPCRINTQSRKNDKILSFSMEPSCKSSVVTPEFSIVFRIHSTVSHSCMSFKNILTLEVFAANVLKPWPNGAPNLSNLEPSYKIKTCVGRWPNGTGFTQGHTTRPCLPLPREPTVRFVHRRRPRHPQLLLYFSCHVSRQLWAAVEVQTNLWSNRNQCGTWQYGYSRYRDDDDNDGDDDDGDDDRDNVDDKGYTCPFVSRMES